MSAIASSAGFPFKALRRKKGSSPSFMLFSNSQEASTGGFWISGAEMDFTVRCSLRPSTWGWTPWPGTGIPCFLSHSHGGSSPFRSDCFHHVLIITSLDHAQDPERFLAEGRRVLRSGGMISLLCGLEGEETGVGQEKHWQKLRSEGVRALVRGTITRFYRFAFRIQDTHPYEFTEEKIKSLMAGCFPEFESKRHSPNILFLKGRVP